jgi:hypothetical protein
MKTKYVNGLNHISNDEYHTSDGVSRSMLIDMERNPYLYWFNHISGKAKHSEATPAMNIGSALHTLVLEPNKFVSEFFITSQQTRPRKDTPPHAKMVEAANGRIIITPDEYELAQDMANSILADSNAVSLLDGCKMERSIYFEHKQTGIQCKFRPDAWAGGIVIDLKSAKDASPRAMQYAAKDYGYYLSAGMAFRALESIGQTMDEYLFICVEKTEPYAVAIYRLDDDALDYGLQQFDDLMFRLEHCIENDKFPSYGIRDLSVPSWLKSSELEEIE